VAIEVVIAAKNRKRPTSEVLPNLPIRFGSFFEREKGSETGITEGRSITRDAVISTGFVNLDPMARDMPRTKVTRRWATGGRRLS
jgi:hypothetical protein